MNRLMLIILFFLVTNASFGQADKDSILREMPMVNGRLVYSDSVRVDGHNRAKLDSNAKKWLSGIGHVQDTLSADKDANSSVLSWCATEFKMTTTSVALVKYKFYLIMVIDVDCFDGYYKYKVFNIYFKPESKLFRIAGYYQMSPEYLIGLLQKDHMGLEPSVDMGRKKIREYLANTNDGVRRAIASLNEGMKK